MSTKSDEETKRLREEFLLTSKEYMEVYFDGFITTTELSGELEMLKSLYERAKYKIPLH